MTLSSKSKRKSLPPSLPVAAPHAGTALLPRSDRASSTARAARSGRWSWITTGCIRTTVTVLVLGAYLVWAWPWHLKHGFGGIPWLGGGEGGGGGQSGSEDVEGSRIVHWSEGEGIVRAPELGVPKEIQTKWGQYSPYHALGKYVGPPEGCHITQVNILQRHGARFPNLKEGEQYAVAVKRLEAAKKFRDKRFKFLKHYEYDLHADDLTPFGTAQTIESGQVAFRRYHHLIDDDNIPFVRASSLRRVVDSAGNWTVGFAAASHQRFRPYVNVVIREDTNSTLHEHCPNAGDGSAQTDAWLSVFAPPLVARLNAAAPGAKLDAKHVFDLMAMCPFESVARAARRSPFCALFDEDEFRDFEYHGDVEKYYKTGYGNPLGRVQGVGYVNELLARLTDTPVHDRTTHNGSLPFPLGRALYADFTHENVLVPVFAALGLFDVSRRPLDPRVRPAYLSKLELDREEGEGEGEGTERKQRWIASQMVPFSARMVTERLECHERDGEEAGAYVRILVNDEVQPLEFCGAAGGKEGMCRLEDFVESQGYARRSGDGDFEKCYN